MQLFRLMEPPSKFENSARFERLGRHVAALQASHVSGPDSRRLSFDQLAEGAWTLILPGQRHLVGITDAACAGQFTLCAVPIDAE
jgi:hypothetical protein